MTSTDWAYLAGIIDGEGCIGVYWDKSSKTYKLTLAISSTSVEWLIALQEKFGLGNVHVQKHKAKKNWKLQAHWSLTHSHAQEILRGCLPYLGIKKSQAELALTFKSAQRKTDPMTGRFIPMSPADRYQQEQIAEMLKDIKKQEFVGGVTTKNSVTPVTVQ